jgi:hypothetical protein
MAWIETITYSRTNFIKSPASGAGNFREPRPMSQVRRVRDVVCAEISAFLQPERWRCQYRSAYVAAAILRLRKEDCKICEMALKVVMQNDGDFGKVILLYWREASPTVSTANRT